MKEKIFIIEDEKNIAELLQYNLQKESYRTSVFHDGARGLEAAVKEIPDLILLDWMLPGLEGIEVCRSLKQNEKTRRIPIIMLTVKNSDADKVLGLEMGADDYVTKPFSPRELLARIKAVLRRARPQAPEDLFRTRGLEIDWAWHQVEVSGQAVELTPKEFELLKALIEASGKILSRERLLDRVWGFDRSGDLETRTVDLHVSQLRKKLKKAGGLILTVKSAGYRFDQDA